MPLILTETEIPWSHQTLPAHVASFVEEGLRRSREIDCFDFVPSHAETLYARLDSLPRGRFCEWGSGIGIGVGIASMLGFTAQGVEIHELLGLASRRLLEEHGLSATIEIGDYFAHPHEADYYFTYCWPGQMNRVEQLFCDSAPTEALLLICHGHDDIRCKVKQYVESSS